MTALKAFILLIDLSFCLVLIILAMAHAWHDCSWFRAECATAPGYPGNLRRIGQ